MEQAPKTAKRRRQGHISVACQACKNRRSKCTGGPPPCSMCAKLDTECHFDPDADMRRRTSRDSTKTYKALLDAFIDSLRRDDTALSRSLHQVIISADPSGRLREVAEEYAESIQPGWLPQNQGSRIDGLGRFDDTVPGVALDLPTVEDLDEYLGLSAYSLSNASSPVNQMYPEPSSLVSPFSPFQQLPVDGVASSSSTPIYPGPYQQAADTQEAGSSRGDTFVDGNVVSKEDLKVYLQSQQGNRQLTSSDLPLFTCDMLVSEPTDAVSRSILAFRDSARQAINSGIAIDRILETSKPDLTLMFRDRLPTDPHTAWSWACDFSKSYDRFSFPLRLATAYIVGIQMRFFINPCAETFNDLPEMLRPLQKQYEVVHPAAIDICHIPALKLAYLDQWDQGEQLQTAGQSCNWPYSDGACLAYDRDRNTTTMSRAFLEHIRQLSNYSVGKSMLDSVPSLRGQVRIIGE